MLDWFLNDPSVVFVVAIALAVFVGTAWLLSAGGKKKPHEEFSQPFDKHQTHTEFSKPTEKEIPAQYLKSRPRRNEFNIRDIGHQLHAVSSAPFEPQKILNLSEYKVFRIIEDLLFRERRDFRVFPQVSLGEILLSSDTNAHLSINSKRLDMVIVNKGGWPVLAIEYQGPGHYQGNVIGRDAVKKEALRKAGVKFLEVVHDDSVELIELHVQEKLGLCKPVNGTKPNENKLRVVAG